MTTHASDMVSRSNSAFTNGCLYKWPVMSIFDFLSSGYVQVACRDYPHPRHLCVKYPFMSTAHENYCNQVRNFICDLAI